jgi:hypothetical protein
MTSSIHSTPTAGDRMRLMILPYEIWCMVAQELSDRDDFETLFHCALTSWGMARTVLPFLYGACHRSPAIKGHRRHKKRAACLWWSIIQSSLDGAIFPYCCWLKELRLGRLFEFLTDLQEHCAWYDMLFRPPLQHLRVPPAWRVRLEMFAAPSHPLCALRAWNAAIVAEVAHMITKCILASAARENKTPTLTCVDAGQFRRFSPVLPAWLSNFTRLTALTLNDGSLLLRGEVAHALRKYCPAFREL